MRNAYCVLRMMSICSFAYLLILLTTFHFRYIIADIVHIYTSFSLRLPKFETRCLLNLFFMVSHRFRVTRVLKPRSRPDLGGA